MRARHTRWRRAGSILVLTAVMMVLMFALLAVAVDLGYVDHDHQVGQTGTTVRPALYIACGISGAVQHRAGMQEAAKILAINTDKDAPIFGVAHYGVVGDMNDVIPKMIKIIRSGGSLKKAVEAAKA